RVVGVRQRPLRDIPRLVPSELRVIEENTHQLGDGHRRMCVIELDGDLLGEQTPVGVVAEEAPHQIGQRASNEEVLLHESQSLSLAGGVIRIKNPGERFSGEGLSQGAYKIATAEFLKVEI